MATGLTTGAAVCFRRPFELFVLLGLRPLSRQRVGTLASALFKKSLRGSCWSHQSQAGVFEVDLSFSRSFVSGDSGFRAFAIKNVVAIGLTSRVEACSPGIWTLLVRTFLQLWASALFKKKPPRWQLARPVTWRRGRLVCSPSSYVCLYGCGLPRFSNK